MLKQYFQNNLQKIIVIITAVISISTYLAYALNGLQNLGNYDAVARLNIARKVVDSLTPGVGQLGGTWLPIPQILMVPFIKIDFFWHTGLAGALVSGAMFILGAVYLYKTAFLLTKSLKVSLLVWLMFVININILLLQTMALSEMFFMSSLIMILYFLTVWIESHKIVHLLYAAIFVVLITLTRYEGYFVFIGSILVVSIECIRLYWRENKQKVEGMIFFYLTLAGFGILLWCMYSFLFYNDFLFWLHVYSNEKIPITAATPAVSGNITASHKLAGIPFVTSFLAYSQAIMWMNGKVTVLLAIVGFFILTIVVLKNIRKDNSLYKYLPLWMISIVLFLFLIYGYHKGLIPQIAIPPILLPLAQRKTFTIYTDSNIRYGIIIAPCLILLAGIAAARKLLFYCVLFLVVFQFIANIYTPDFFQYSLPQMWPYSTMKQVPWFRSHYDSGLVLISSNSHEDFIFQSGLPYSKFIYEGSRNYWMESLNNPAKYTSWVIFDDRIRGDSLNVLLTQNARNILKERFDLVYDVDGFQVYHLREN